MSAKGGSPSPPGPRLRQIGQMFRRRVWLILAVLMLLNGTALLAISKVTPRYTAEASLIIGPRQAKVIDVKDVIAGLSGDSDVIESELQILRSRRIAREVVEQLRLDQVAEFNPGIKSQGRRQPTLRERIVSAVDTRVGQLAALLPAGCGLTLSVLPQVSPSAGELERDPLGWSTDAFLTRLYIAPKGRSRVIGVAVESADPALAAAAANAVIEAYIHDQLRAKLDATEHAHKWLSERVSEMREQVLNADHAVESYRQKVGIVQGRTSTLQSEQLSELSQKLVQAHVDRTIAELRARLADGGRDLLDAINFPTAQALRTQESALLQQAAALSHSFGENFPKLAELRSQIADTRLRLRQELARTVNGFREEARNARLLEESIQGTLASLRQEVGVSLEGEIELRALQHEADADRALYDRLLTRSKETKVESGLQQADAQIISRAEAPELPSFPNPKMILPIFFLTSVIVVVLLVFALEQLNHSFSGPEQVETTLGVAALGVVPWLRRSTLLRRVPATYVLEYPDSQFAEGMRSLHTSLLLSELSRVPKVMLLASALPSEGKTTVALSLARLVASCDKRVVLVDCDLRQPDVHKACGAPQSPGLTDFLAGQAELSDVLRRDQLSQAWVIPAGKQSQTAPDLFSSEAMRRMIAALSEQFDLVLLDSAPVLAVSDTRNLARLVDKIVFVVRWQVTRRAAARTALRQMVDAGGDVAGVLLSMVDLRRYAKYSAIGSYHRDIRLYLRR